MKCTLVWHVRWGHADRIGSRQVGKRQENNKFQAQCVVAALVYFVPQDPTVLFSSDFLVYLESFSEDVVFLGRLFYLWHSTVLIQVHLRELPDVPMQEYEPLV